MLKTSTAAGPLTLRSAATLLLGRIVALRNIDPLPRSFLLVALTASIVWVGGVLWAASAIDGASSGQVEQALALNRSELSALQSEVQSLGAEVDLLRLERRSLLARIDGVSQAAAAPVIAAAASAPPAGRTAEETMTGVEVLDAALPVVGEPAGADGSVPPAPAPQPTAATAATAPPPSSAMFVSGAALDTAGVDLYNCRNFASWEQAQAVYLASGPGDPNRIDTDRDGTACESLLR